MAKYKTDMQDVKFNLFDVLEVQNHQEYGLQVEDLTPILEEYNKFIENEVFPTREPSDLEGVKLEGDQVLVPECFKAPKEAFYANGWYALGVPEEFEGAPVPEAVSIACNSFLGSANVAFSMYFGLTKGAMNVIRMKGSDEQKKSFIPPMMSGAWGGTMCLTEPSAGSDVGAARTTAKPLANGRYAIEGTKIFISSGDNDLYQNIIHLVLARTPGAPEGTKGLSLFIVPKYKVNEDGSLGESNNVKCSKVEHKMGIHASATCELQFGDGGSCEGVLIGEELEGMSTMFIMMNEARLLCGIQGESQANLAYEMSKQYASERGQFGTEIENLPDVRLSLLKMRAMSRGMRALAYYTADLFDRDQEDLVSLLTPICKSYMSEQGFNVASEAVQVHGGYGYCTEYGVEQFIRDTKIAMIYEGTNGIQAIDFVTRKILKDGGKTIGKLASMIQKTVEGLDAKWETEQQLFSKVLASAQQVLDHIGALAKKKQMNAVLQQCTDVQQFCSQLVVAWRLLESALVADQKLNSASGDEKNYYQSKIDDLKVYCTHYLSHNISISKTILNDNLDVSAMVL